MSGIAQSGQNIAAGSLKVIGLAIKGEIMGVSRGRAGATRDVVAAQLACHNPAGLLGTTGVVDTMDHPSYAVTGAQLLTFIIQELLVTFVIASIVIASAGCWWHTLVAIEDKPIITLTPILALSDTGEGEREAGAGRRTRASAELIMAV